MTHKAAAILHIFSVSNAVRSLSALMTAKRRQESIKTCLTVNATTLQAAWDADGSKNNDRMQQAACIAHSGCVADRELLNSKTLRVSAQLRLR